MNEEEIIDKVENIAKNAVEYDHLHWEDIDAIQGLLDLYQKEKEKNKELQKYMKEYLLPKSTINLVYVSKDKIEEIADDYESKGYIEIAGAMRELLEERN